jgi:meso-butanediol dehydrogenase/(S,S)-butanediol dehydrogenase/diacetyl reductase
MSSENKAALVTGAASGIGAATVRRLVRGGANVLAVDMNPDGLNKLAAELGDAVHPHIAELTDRAQVEGAVEAAVQKFGKLDILINNAGIGSLARVTDLDPEEWRRVMSIDVDAIFFACRVALPHLIATGGAVVNTASISGMAADYGFTAYNTAKAAVIGLTRVMAIDYAAKGVRINSVSPGLTQTPLIQMMPQELQDQYASNIPIRRAASPDEIAAVIAFLTSSDASYIIGQNIAVDGGLMATTGSPDHMTFFQKMYAGG